MPTSPGDGDSCEAQLQVSVTVYKLWYRSLWYRMNRDQLYIINLRGCFQSFYGSASADTPEGGRSAVTYCLALVGADTVLKQPHDRVREANGRVKYMIDRIGAAVSRSVDLTVSYRKRLFRSKGPRSCARRTSGAQLEQTAPYDLGMASSDSYASVCWRSSRCVGTRCPRVSDPSPVPQGKVGSPLGTPLLIELNFEGLKRS